MFWPACEAPLFVPACSPMMAWPAFSCSSVKLRLHSSAGFGPRNGPLNSGSTVWNTSRSGTPYRLIACWNRLMFSIILNWPPDVLILATAPGSSLLISLHRIRPSRSASSYRTPAGNFSPSTSSTQYCASLSFSRYPAAPPPAAAPSSEEKGDERAATA
uniref:Uncharacterized protein n=1 Tax=Anopheles atroparvus TaxID=41427 RepID=A0A182ING0_ANOAO